MDEFSVDMICCCQHFGANKNTRICFKLLDNLGIGIIWPCLESSIFGTVPRFFGKLLAKVFMHLFNDTVAWGY